MRVKKSMKRKVGSWEKEREWKVGKKSMRPRHDRHLVNNHESFRIHFSLVYCNNSIPQDTKSYAEAEFLDICKCKIIRKENSSTRHINTRLDWFLKFRVLKCFQIATKHATVEFTSQFRVNPEGQSQFMFPKLPRHQYGMATSLQSALLTTEIDNFLEISVIPKSYHHPLRTEICHTSDYAKRCQPSNVQLVILQSVLSLRILCRRVKDTMRVFYFHISWKVKNAVRSIW